MPEVTVDGQRWVEAKDLDLLMRHLEDAHKRINQLERDHCETIKRLAEARHDVAKVKPTELEQQWIAEAHRLRQAIENHKAAHLKATVPDRDQELWAVLYGAG